ncbi:hypothetical protein L0337_11635 [candidate division KSB1 bacterium]|nr:hypothetical protein [candidate division KSB1 bacterium]
MIAPFFSSAFDQKSPVDFTSQERTPSLRLQAGDCTIWQKQFIIHQLFAVNKNENVVAYRRCGAFGAGVL